MSRPTTDTDYGWLADSICMAGGTIANDLLVLLTDAERIEPPSPLHFPGRLNRLRRLRLELLGSLRAAGYDNPNAA